MQTQLPDQLKSSLDKAINGRGLAPLQAASARMSARYRRTAEHASQSLGLQSDDEALAYATTRLPATYAACLKVFEQIQLQNPDWAPTHMLDIGAGLGGLTWAARTLWGTDLPATLLEPNQHMRKLGQNWLHAQATWHPRDLAALSDLSVTAPFVGASYVLNELTGNALTKAIQDMWAATTDSLVIIEPGTKQGFDVIMQARQQLVEQGAHIPAPCPHTGPCPLSTMQDRWCHMRVRVQRSRTHIQLKEGAERGYEDEPYSYIIATRTPWPRPTARLIGQPRLQGPIKAELCQADGTVGLGTYPKSHALYKTLRRADWGDGIDNTPEQS